jgi:hypothetical protein
MAHERSQIVTSHPTTGWESILAMLTRESDLAKVQILACMLEEAIFEREQELALAPNDVEEKQALNRAINHLYSVRVNKLGFPDWKKRAG